MPINMLAGKRAVITGSGRGIGRAIALALAEAGADIGVTARTLSDLELLAAEIQAMGRRCFFTSCDVTVAKEVAEMASRLAHELEGIDILVNNAGSAESHKFLDHPDEMWHRMLAANLTSVYYVTKAFLPSIMEQQGGRIINIASTAARVGDKYVVAYAAAKHGVLGLTRSLAAELIQHNITVNAVCPGFVDTPMTQTSIDNIVRRTGLSEEEARAALEKTNPQGRLITPEEVAWVVLFLAQESSKGITGQAINVDGGGVMS
jgi:NAD(P)-dependent dehydrogenase (short-subunit alcohol dehydrogenase family)